MKIDYSLFMIMAMIIIAIITLLLPTNATQNPALSNASINKLTPIGINTPIYVIGPTALAQEFVKIGINKSLIKIITLNQLPELPNGSIVIIDWSLIKPSIAINNTDGMVFINLTSPVIHELVNAIAGGGCCWCIRKLR